MSNLLDYFIDKSKQDLDIEIIKYGCKLLMSSVVGTLIVIFFALLIYKIEDAVIFLISFSFLENTAVDTIVVPMCVVIYYY